MKTVKTIAGALLCLALCLAATAAMAHDLWLTCPSSQAGQKLTVEIGYGHGFPKGEPIDAKLLVTPFVVGANSEIKTELKGECKYETVKPLPAGSYVVASGRIEQWYTKSPAGSVNKPKNEVPEATRCVRSVKYAKALVNLGGKTDPVRQVVGQDLEIVPLVNPGALKAGADLPVKVLLAGKPLAKAEVTATFAGFSKEGAMAFYAKTNAEGLVNIKLWSAGLWLVKVSHKSPFADPAKCDEWSKTAVLTFELK